MSGPAFHPSPGSTVVNVVGAGVVLLYIYVVKEAGERRGESKGMHGCCSGSDIDEDHVMRFERFKQKTSI